MFGRLLAAFFAFAFCSCAAMPALADEGQWTYDNFPSRTVGQKYGFTPSQAFLDHLRLSSARIAFGCSSSFVSPNGLVMTNHHCALECVSQLSTPQQNFTAKGFFAKTQADEKVCPGFEIDRLDAIADRTADVGAATAGKTGAGLTAALNAVTAKLESSCGSDVKIKCELVSLYHGGVYDLYRYRRYTDVRLAFAPEFTVAQFGGDPDNFNFPRFDFDVAFVRAYDDGKPASTPDFLHWSRNGSKADDLVFVSGNPGTTQRELTVSQLAYLRDDAYPLDLQQIQEVRGLLEQYQTEGSEQYRQTRELLFYIENDYKETAGEERALQTPSFFKIKTDEENALRAAVAAKPELQSAYGSAWDDMTAIQDRKRRLALRYTYEAQGPYSTAFANARTLVRLPVEKAKPDAERLPEYSDANLVTLPQQLLAPIPYYPGTDELLLNVWAKQMREDLGTDDPFVKKVLGTKSPAQWAHDLVTGTKLGDPAARKALLDGGAPAVASSTDSMIRFVAGIDADARAVRKEYEDTVTSPQRTASEKIAKASFAITGTSVYPDATFTLRLSYGAVKGFTNQNGDAVKPYTTMGGLFDRATGSDPYVLPQSWLGAKPSLDLTTPMNLSTTNDIIGGNSGSPVVDKNGDVVGLIFDGNIFSLGGDFAYDESANRSVAVDSRALLAGLRKVYHADRLAAEIAPK